VSALVEFRLLDLFNMEQIDLELVKADSRWSDDDEFERNEKLTRFPHSVLVATTFNEIDLVEERLTKTVGPEGINWELIFYFKQSYDFGYAEYFFLDEGFSIVFINELGRFYGVFANGKKLRTNREGEYFDVD
jgi:hypothetical protein